MSQPKPKKISRRDAIKLLGAAAGATVLANLPSKWSKPELTRGVLPAHAQTSLAISCELFFEQSWFTQPDGEGWYSAAAVGLPGVTLRYTLTFVNTCFSALYPGPQAPNPVVGTVVTGAGGTAQIGSPGYPGNSANGDLDSMEQEGAATSGSFTIRWEFDDPAQYGSAFCTQSASWLTPVLPIVTTDNLVDQSIGTSLMDFFGTVVSDGGAPVTARGFVWSTSSITPPALNLPPSPNAVVSPGIGTGAFSSIGVNASAATIFIRAYATNSVGTAYGNELFVLNQVCLAAGTLVTLADGTTKPIEDIRYTDMLRVWNFDEGRFDEAKPLWIKRAEWTSQVNHLEFSDGSFLETINQHRIFNKEMGRFTYPMTEDTPIGTTTFNVQGEEVTLVNKYVMNKEVAYYNIITYHHMNLFGNGILTSVGYNNLYPIENMKFIKEERELIPQEEYGLEDRFYYGLRLAEQDIPVADTIEYVNKRKALELQPEPVL